jgi:hypothetical protein
MKGISIKVHENTLYQRGDIFHSYGLRVMAGTVKTILLHSLVMVVNVEHASFSLNTRLPKMSFWVLL